MKNFKKKLLQRAHFAAKLAELVPFVLMIGLNGSLAQNKVNKNSDIDFLVITKAGRIFTARFFLTAMYHLFGLKRTKKKIAGQICLNRFITDKSLKIIPRDNYHIKNYSQTIPLYDVNTYQSFMKKNHWSKQNISCLNKVSFIKKILELILNNRFGDWLENKLKQYQLKKIIKNPLTKQKKGIIIANDFMLCFHPTSKTNIIKIDDVKQA